MLRLFRINDPLRILPVALVLLVLRIPMLFGIDEMLLSELTWMLVGEKMNNGEHLYTEVWESIAPLSALIYTFIDLIFGRSLFIYRTLSLVLVFVQALIFNSLALNKDLFEERTYIPAVLYVIFMSSIPDFMTLSPALMATTLLLLIMRRIISLNEYTNESDFLRLGWLMGLCVLFQFSGFVFTLWLFIGMSVFKTSSAREYTLVFFGSLLPLGIFLLYMFYQDGLTLSMRHFVLPALQFSPKPVFTASEFLYIVAPPALLLLFAALRVFVGRSYINFQTYCQQMMVFWFFIGMAGLLFVYELSSYHLLFFGPVWVFFITHFLLRLRKKWFADILFTLLLLYAAFNNINMGAKLVNLDSYVNYAKIYVPDQIDDFPYKDKTIWVVGDDKRYYRYNKAATPYLNWSLSKEKLNQIRYYDALIETYNEIEEARPDIIIDSSGEAHRLFEKIDILGEKYISKDGMMRLYFRKKE